MNGTKSDSNTSMPLQETSSSDENLHHGRPRKPSHPLMPPFMVSAPGKVIVYGEHAVVHGKAAIAAAISLRSYLLVTFLSKTHRTVTLTFPDISFSYTWPIHSLPWSDFAAPDKKKAYYDMVTVLDSDLLDALRPHVANISPHESPANRKIHQNTAIMFLYLYLSLSSPQSPACIYTLRSTIPIGAGLGSSASIAVCVSAALLLQIRALAGPHHDQPAKEAALQVERVNRWAFVAECCIHGNPSGVDNTVSSHGKAVLFQRKDYNKPSMVKTLPQFPELPLLLVNTKQSRSTSVEVAKVAAMRIKYPRIAEYILDAIDTVTREAHVLISGKTESNGKADDGDDNDDDDDEDDDENEDDEDSDETKTATPANSSKPLLNTDDQLTRLGELASINHGLLVSLGVSHPKLERIRELVDHAGIGWTKLTGAGGGGCAMTLLRPGASLTRSVARSTGRVRSKSVVLRDLEAQLEAEGFDKFETTLGGDGVGVLWPAVVHHGSAAAASASVQQQQLEEEGGEEINQEKFLRAVGNEGIEKLVGVRESNDGWKFWKC